MEFTGQRRDEVYRWIGRTLVQHEYVALSRGAKGLLGGYLARMTGLSRARITRLIAGYTDTGVVRAAVYQRTKFATRYTKQDVDLLAYIDRSHGNLSGPATSRILEREYSEYGQAAYQRLAGISVAQIYRFRNSEDYRRKNTSYQPTRPTVIPNRRTAQAAPGGASRVSAHRHRTSGRPGRSQGYLSHQRGGRSHAMGNRGGHAANLRTLADSARWSICWSSSPL